MAANTVLCALLAALLAALCAGEADVTHRLKRPLTDQRLAELQTYLALEAMGRNAPQPAANGMPDPRAVGRKRSSPPEVWRLLGDVEAQPEEYGSNPGDWSVSRYLRTLQV